MCKNTVGIFNFVESSVIFNGKMFIPHGNGRGLPAIITGAGPKAPFKQKCYSNGLYKASKDCFRSFILLERSWQSFSKPFLRENFPLTWLAQKSVNRL